MSNPGEEAQKILNDHNVRLLYFAVLIVLVALIAWYTKPKSSERYVGKGAGLTEQSVFSGPDVRFAGQFTGTNQGPNAPLGIDGNSGNSRSGERLTASREPPVFYDISQTLGAYQYASQFSCPDGNVPMPVRDSYGNMTYACPGDAQDVNSAVSGGQTGIVMTPAERMTTSPATAVQEALLMQQLGY